MASGDAPASIKKQLSTQDIPSPAESNRIGRYAGPLPVVIARRLQADVAISLSMPPPGARLPRPLRDRAMSGTGQKWSFAL
jgi:hypothetical protein